MWNMPGHPAVAPTMTMRMRAVWNGVVLAESDDTVVVEGNHYFPADSVDWQHFTESDTHTICPWKGTASYHTVVAGGASNPDAAWYYPDPKPAAKQIKGRVAFWRGVQVEPVPNR
jgi:uncharacterized protein (DUF427 family)